MFHRHLFKHLLIVSALTLMAAFPIVGVGQDTPFPQATNLQHGPPLTNQEYVSMLYQLPKHPDQRDLIVNEIRKRGIAFPVTPGLLSLTATKSGNDPVLRRTLEEANHRREDPAAASLPPATEGLDLLDRTRKATLGAAKQMPDYLVKQQIARSRALGTTSNWNVYDRLSIAVSYRQTVGEQYKLLSVNGMPPNVDEQEGSTYGDKLGGTTSTGEYVSMLSELFEPATRADFEMVDTDTLRGHRTIVYEYAVKREFSKQTLKFQASIDSAPVGTIVGYQGRIWVDRDDNRVLRLETISVEIPAGFPITAAKSVIDYDWVSINDVSHLLPSRAVIELTSHLGAQTEQTRNDILFRGYRKFGAEVKITDINEKDFPPDKPEETDPNKQPAAPIDANTPPDPNKPPPVPILKKKP
ncbi:MAG TPA: hypothetical protein VN696_00360 [Pyrinomonadaceae bacterium]|nr:hypothetical protein [Pyrinomonadaceae bacterium]